MKALILALTLPFLPCEKPLPADLIQYSETHTAMYRKRFWKRLLTSISPWAEVGAERASVRAEAHSVEVFGSGTDADRPSLSSLAPHRFALGFGGRAEFWDFCNL